MNLAPFDMRDAEIVDLRVVFAIISLPIYDVYVRITKNR